MRNLPFLSNFTTRVSSYPSVTKKVPSGSQAMSVWRPKVSLSGPIFLVNDGFSVLPVLAAFRAVVVFSVPMVCSSFLPSLLKMRITWWPSSMAHTRFSGSYGLMRIL